MFHYPLEDNVFTKFFTLVNLLLSMKTLDDLMTIREDIDKLQQKYQVISDQFNSAIRAGIDAELPSGQQADLLVCEGRIISTLKAMYNYQLESMQAQLNSVVESYAGVDVENLSKQSHVSSSPFANCLNLYLTLIGNVVFVKRDEDFSNMDVLSRLIISTTEIIHTIVAFGYELADEPDVVMCVPVEWYQMMRDASKIGFAYNASPRNEIEAMLLSLIRMRVDLLLHVRSQQVAKIQDYKAANIVEGTKYDHELLIRITEDSVLQIDGMARLLNLTGYPKYRALYARHHQRHYLRREYLDSSAYINERRIAIVSGLINPDTMLSDIAIAVKLLEKYLCLTQDLFETYMILVDTDHDYELDKITNTLILQVKNILYDANFLIPFAAKYEKQDAGQSHHLLRNLQTIARLSLIILYTYDDEAYGRYERTIFYTEIHHIDLNSLTNRAFTSFYGLLYQTRFTLRLATSADPVRRLEIYKTFIEELKTFLIRYRFECVSDEVKMQAAHFIMELYLTALYSCKHQAEVELISDAELKNDLFALNVYQDNRQIYEFVFMLLSKYKEPNHVGLPIKDMPISRMEPDFVYKLFQAMKVAIKRFTDNQYRPGVRAGTFFLLKAGIVSECVCYGGYSQDSKIEASAIIQGVIAYQNRLYQKSMRYVERVSPARLSYRATTFDDKDEAEVKATFLQGLTLYKPAVRKSKKSNSKKKVTASDDYHPYVGDDFATLKKYFKENPEDLYGFCFRFIHNRDALTAVKALLGCAQTLYCFEDDSRAQVLAKRLLNESKSVFDHAVQYVLESSFSDYKSEFERLLKPWETRSNIVQPAVVHKSPEVLQPVTKIRQAVVRVPTMITSYRPSSDVILDKKPKNPLPLPPVCQDEFEGLRVQRRLLIRKTSQQAAVIDLLKHMNSSPMVHGGTVVDLLFGIPPRDLDLLCFANIDRLMALLTKHKAQLSINKIRRNVGRDVVVVEFNQDGMNLEHSWRCDAKLEILVLPPDQIMRLQVINLARGYGVIFLLYDLTAENIIDPVKLYQKLVDKNMLDSQVCAIDIDAYLAKNPARIMDILYRMAKFHAYQQPLNMSKELDDAVRSNIYRLKSLKKKLSIDMFDKLFMQGFACSFLAEFRKFAHINFLFPALIPYLYESFHLVCANLDALLQRIRPEGLSDEKLAHLRILFFTNAFYDSFMHERDLVAYRYDSAQFYKDCNFFFAEMIFETRYDSDCGALINAVQDNWWKRIQLIFTQETIISYKK